MISRNVDILDSGQKTCLKKTSLRAILIFIFIIWFLFFGTNNKVYAQIGAPGNASNASPSVAISPNVLSLSQADKWIGPGSAEDKAMLEDG